VRSQTAYLVFLMAMMGILALIRLGPPEETGVPRGLDLSPAGLIVAVSMLIGAIGVSLRRPFSLAMGLGAAGVTVLIGLLTAFGVGKLRLPGLPILWVVVGLYVGFRLTLNQQKQRQLARQSRLDQLRKDTDAAADAEEVEEEAPDADPAARRADAAHDDRP
jgi:hypothetical protein